MAGCGDGTPIFLGEIHRSGVVKNRPRALHTVPDAGTHSDRHAPRLTMKQPARCYGFGYVGVGVVPEPEVPLLPLPPPPMLGKTLENPKEAR